MIKIGAVWKKEKEDGTTFFSGKIDIPASVILNPGLSIFLFKNRSDHEQSPALDVFIAEPQKKKNESKGGDDLEEF